MGIMFKRFFFFSMVNILVLLTISIVFSIGAAYFGVDISGYQGLIIWCALFGMTGSFILFSSNCSYSLSYVSYHSSRTLLYIPYHVGKEARIIKKMAGFDAKDILDQHGVHLIRVPTIEPLLNHNWFLQQIKQAQLLKRDYIR